MDFLPHPTIPHRTTMLLQRWRESNHDQLAESDCDSRCQAQPVPSAPGGVHGEMARMVGNRTRQSPCFTSAARRVRTTRPRCFVTPCRFAFKLHPHVRLLLRLSHPGLLRPKSTITLSLSYSHPAVFSNHCHYSVREPHRSHHLSVTLSPCVDGGKS